MILVTGSTGNIGSKLVAHLKQANAEFRVFARSQAKASQLEAQGISVIYGDLDDLTSVRTALAEVDRLFLLTLSSPKQVKQEQSILEEAKRAGIRHVVRLSAIAVDQRLGITLHEWQKQCDDQLMASGLAYTILRPNSFMQNIVGHAYSVANANTIYAPAGEAQIGFVDAYDIAAVAAKALMDVQHQGKIYEITGAKMYSYAEVAQKLSTKLGRTIQYVNSPQIAQESMITAGLPEWEASAIVELFEKFYAVGKAALITDTVQQVTGYPPQTLDAYLEQNIAAFTPCSRRVGAITLGI